MHPDLQLASTTVRNPAVQPAANFDWNLCVIRYSFALAEQMLQTPLSIEQGELILLEGPGLGVKVNEAVIRRFPYRTGPCSSFQPTGA